MEVATHGNPHQHLARNYTAPVHAAPHHHHPLQGAHLANMSASHQSPLVHSQAHTSSNYSIQSQPSSRSSDTTQGTSHSTLFPPPTPSTTNGSMAPTSGGMPNGGDVAPTANIMNSVADASSSLFQICVTLRQRLYGVPGFNDTLLEEEEYADQDTDPVTLLWRTFRRGYPLMFLYNALRPSQPLQVNDGMKAEKRGKAATFKFLQACVNDLKFPADECFIVTDLFGDDTTGFVKVTRVVNRVLDILVQRGLVEDVQPTATDFENANKSLKRTQRQHIVSEMVTTERTYVQHLELLQAFKRLVEEKGVIPGDAVHDIFLNLNALLDFQRRFLIRVEQTNAQPEEEQNWGKLFLLYNDAFKVYEPYIANQRKCEKTVVAEFNKLKEAGGSAEMRQIVESPTALYGFLMKPFQRLSKYPLLLEDLYKKGDLDEERKADLQVGKEAATSVLSRTNLAVDKEEKADAVQELKFRVEDWKGHRVEGFGDLLLYGTFTVLKSENPTNGKDAERQYHVYLFETILLCCKDIDLSKPKNKLASKPLVDKRGKPKLQLKGRIFMQNVTDLVSLSKPGSYTCQIFWKGDPSIENFIIRFTTEDMMRKWAMQIESQRKRYRERTRNSDGSRAGGTSQTEFEFMRNQPALENPYARHGEDEEEDDSETLVGSGAPSWGSQQSYNTSSSEYSKSRNASQSSLRSRSTTSESGGPPPSAAAQSRAMPPRLPPGSLSQQPQLSLRTRELQQQMTSPGDRGGESYFSPTPDSPMSSARTSSSSNLHNYSFPNQQLPQNGYYQEGNGATRFTAPAMGRPPMGHREPSAPVANGYTPPGARGPPTRGMHSAQQMPAPRNRSASSPDIHNNAQYAQRRGPQPPMPGLPAEYQGYQHGVPRSQSNSPSLQLQNGMPSRAPSQSPQLRRDQSFTRQQDPSPTSQYPYDGRQDMRGAQYPGSRAMTPVGARGNNFVAPPPSTGTPLPPNDVSPPTQLKVKVHAPSASQVLTLVVPLNISYQSLKDRIDAKLQRSTNLTLTPGPGPNKDNLVKLKYLDEDDYVTIQTDEDVLEAFETWREQRGADFSGEGTGMGEIELFCQR